MKIIIIVIQKLLIILISAKHLRKDRWRINVRSVASNNILGFKKKEIDPVDLLIKLGSVKS